MATTVDEFLRVAASQIGQHEVGSTNNVKFNTWYYGHAVSGANFAWCDVFISWVGEQTASRDIVGHFAYTPSHVNWFKANKRWGNVPKRGALVFYNWKSPSSPPWGTPQHVGVVESVNPDGSLVVIEGNAQPDVKGDQSNGGGVYRRHRSTYNVIGYGYPEYTVSRKVVRATTYGALATALGVSLTALLGLNPGSSETTVVDSGKTIVAPATAKPTAAAPDGTVLATPDGTVKAPVTVAPPAPVVAAPIPTGKAPASAHPTLSQGDTGVAVRTVQKASRVPVDGSYGPKTKTGVARLQKAHGLTADGVVGPRTWVVVDAVTSTRTLSYGATGADVTVVQRSLGISADGVYGRRTLLAVEAFQKRHGLTPDGVVGSLTRASLIK